MSALNSYWSYLDRNDAINEFESRWTAWSVKDTIEWFYYIFATKGNLGDSSVLPNAGSGGVSNSHAIDDIKSDANGGAGGGGNGIGKVDYKKIEQRLLDDDFRAVESLRVIEYPFQIRQWGFKNEHHCNLLCQETKRLLAKYPYHNGHPQGGASRGGGLGSLGSVGSLVSLGSGSVAVGVGGLGHVHSQQQLQQQQHVQRQMMQSAHGVHTPHSVHSVHSGHSQHGGGHGAPHSTHSGHSTNEDNVVATNEYLEGIANGMNSGMTNGMNRSLQY